jgi:hypothetical protein
MAGMNPSKPSDQSVGGMGSLGMGVGDEWGMKSAASGQALFLL